MSYPYIGQRRRDGGCQEIGGEKLEECCKELGQLAEASKEGLGSKRAVVPMMMMMMMTPYRGTSISCFSFKVFPQLQVNLNYMKPVISAITLTYLKLSSVWC